MILVKTFFAFNELRNYSYLIVDDQTGDSWVIDPFEAVPIIDHIKKNGCTLKGILNTHQHFDHIRGNAPLIEAFQAPVKKLKNSEKLQLSETYWLETLDTPGHTMDHQVFVWKNESTPLALFSGDTLFNAGVGNCKNGGDVNLLYQTTQNLVNGLAPSTLLYPGHDYLKRNLEFALKVEPENKDIRERLLELSQVETSSLGPVTLADEARVNPFLRLKSPEIQSQLPKNLKTEKELFIHLRKLRDQW
jgi:hydroxyacylglutathione hydrolase